MIYWWRRSLAAQFIGFTLLALVVSQAITFLISWDERAKALQAAMKSEFFSRSASITRLMETIAPELRERVLLASETSYSRFWLSNEDISNPTVWRSRAVEELARPLDNFVDLSQKFGLNASSAGARLSAQDVAKANSGENWTSPMQVLWNQPQPAKFVYFDGRSGYGLAIRLNDGVWLNCAYHKVDTTSWWNSKSLTSLGTTALILSLIGVFIASRIARPLRRLAVSAEALGRGENLPPLPEEGPDDIRRTSEAFNRMQQRLHRFVEDRTRMLAAIGHDLRTPLTSLRLRAEFVKDAEVQEKMVSTIDELRSMTEAAISFAQGESTVEETRAIELQALVSSICDDLADIGLPVVYMDGDKTTYRCRPDGLRRAVRNLAENAVRYAGHARVYVQQSAAGVDIVVEDNGPGIPEGMTDKVFAPFFRLETSRNRDTGGVGLGLSIARAVARQHGGDIALYPNNPGLKAVISLPKEGRVDPPSSKRSRNSKSAISLKRPARNNTVPAAEPQAPARASLSLPRPKT
ncbi:sensor histidine kinase [Rhizobium sullae]|uniref:histidine kinase n=1 Tax=Rhizobium sullae TaxID=50338 RepID=A0A2N0D628_RHISU|nr:HAMP domain-containing sensor histidine kinase [Rhizobium sullae]PKA41512.1 sensor histidine kinase [Rhizobium sullae]TCU14463.1 signal transduction histidine kinase [Rhizobium sullae]UWU13151.1 HAMP domain-containing histidine kinase [Rhizobium sullae]